MRSVRRAVLATFLCAAPLSAASAHASNDLLSRTALREVVRQSARASSRGAVPLPLPEPPRAAPSELGSIARAVGRERVLVGVRAHADAAAVARELRHVGARPRVFRTMGVLAATVPSGAALARALRGDPRVAYVERDRRLRTATDPFDTVDQPWGSGIKYTWAFDAVRAADALAAAGGGSSRTVAVIDTGLDVSHPEFADRVARTYDTAFGDGVVTDAIGHGTFVTGLIAAVDGNGIGGKGVAGATRVIAVRASTDGGFTVGELIAGIEFAIQNGARVINMSLAGEDFTRSQARALETAFVNDVLPVAASGNEGQRGNPLGFPAAALGGARGGRGIGLSVAATRPDGSWADFSSYNDYVSLAAPGAGASGCEFGVFSTIPASYGTEWDSLDSCSRVYSQGGARFAYGEGTSFSAPIAAGVAALAWQVEPRLASEQVAEVLVRSARQTVGSGWNEFTGAGVVDGGAAAALARSYDVSAPRPRGRARRRGRGAVGVRVGRVPDRTEPGRELAGGVRYGLLVSRDGGDSFSIAVRPRRRPFRERLRLRGRRANVLVAWVCDGNGNCAVKRLGRFRDRG
jgi:subtilisin family serine protease